jgi:hypothetical protein
VDVTKLWQDQDAIHSTLEKIFAREEFQDKPQGWTDWFLELVKAFFKWLGTLYDNSSWWFWLLLIVCVLVLVLLLCHIVYSVYRVFYQDPRRQQTAASGNLRRQLSLRYVHDAEKLAAKAEYTEAIRHLFLSLVYYYDEKEEFLFRPALTNHEYLQGFVKQKELHQELNRFVNTLDERWYGMQACSEADYQSFRQSYDYLVKARRRP